MIVINQLASYALIFVVVGLILSFGALIMSSTQTSMATQLGCVEGNAVTGCDNATLFPAYQPGTNVLTGLGTMGSWLPILAIVIVAGIVITLLLGSFMLRPNGAA